MSFQFIKFTYNKKLEMKSLNKNRNCLSFFSHTLKLNLKNYIDIA